MTVKDRNRARSTATPNVLPVDRLPPHSIEAEQGVLGCALWRPQECLEVCRDRISTASVFYDLRHQVLYETLLGMHEAREPIDFITLHQRLKDQNQLESIGGLTYLTSLQDAVPSPANLSYYLAIMLEKALAREMLALCALSIGRLYEEGNDLSQEELAATVENLRERALELSRRLDVQRRADGEVMPVDALLDFKSEEDPNCILGERYLCRGGGCVVVGPSGIGKSSIAMQGAITWAVGRDLFGIAPKRPLKSMIIEAENDLGDMAEMMQGVLAGLEIEEFGEEIEAIRERLVIIRSGNLTGPDFIRSVHRHVLEHKPDIVWLDPLLSFIGDDISRQDVCAKFLRNGLNPIGDATGCVWMLIHHTTKPPSEKRQWNPSDYSYYGAGSAELTNWPRAVMVLKEESDGLYELKLAKRGKRAGARDLEWQPTRSVWLKHGEMGICWQQTRAPENEGEEGDARPQGKGRPSGGRPSAADEIKAMNSHDYVARIPADGWSRNKVAKELRVWMGTAHKKDVSESTCRRAIQGMVANGKLKMNAEGNYIKGNG